MASRVLYSVSRDGLGFAMTTQVNKGGTPVASLIATRRSRAGVPRDGHLRDDDRDRGVLLRRRLHAVVSRRVPAPPSRAERAATVSREGASVDDRLRAGRVAGVPDQRRDHRPAE